MQSNPKTLTPKQRKQFSNNIISWYQQHGRKTLPWQQNRTPYRVWVSEIMLQQTQVTTVIDYYLRFMDAFPTVNDLAVAPIDEVLKLWTGLGYYARARNLHKAANTVVNEFGGEFPTCIEQIQTLPGIGRSTGAAILSLALNQPHPILDGNVKRIIARCFTVDGWYGQAKVLKQMWTIVEDLSPTKDIQPYNQALMDIGSAICTRSKPKCELCPVADFCIANKASKTAEYPHKKPKKDKPVKSQWWPILICDGKVMLNQRPPSGIWGGLYSFSDFESEAQLTNYCHENQLVTNNTKHLEPMVHIFTHFQLNIQPIVIELELGGKHSQIADNNMQIWHPIGNEPAFGVPTPVVKLLKAIAAYRN